MTLYLCFFHLPEISQLDWSWLRKIMQYFKLIFLLLGLIIGFSKSQNSQEENKLALEIRGLINKEIKGSGCPCINVLQCFRTREILEKTKGLSKNHPERSTFIEHIRSLSRTCDIKNKEVRCCERRAKVCNNWKNNLVW